MREKERGGKRESERSRRGKRENERPRGGKREIERLEGRERPGEGEERLRGRREISRRIHFVRLGSTWWLHFAISGGNSGQYGFG